MWFCGGLGGLWRLWSLGITGGREQGQRVLAAMVTKASPFLASPTVALSFGGKHLRRSSAGGNFKQRELSLGFNASGVWGLSSFSAEVKRVAVAGSLGTTLALLFTSEIGF